MAEDIKQIKEFKHQSTQNGKAEYKADSGHVFCGVSYTVVATVPIPDEQGMYDVSYQLRPNLHYEGETHTPGKVMGTDTFDKRKCETAKKVNTTLKDFFADKYKSRIEEKSVEITTFLDFLTFNIKTKTPAKTLEQFHGQLTTVANHCARGDKLLAEVTPAPDRQRPKVAAPAPKADWRAAVSNDDERMKAIKIAAGQAYPIGDEVTADHHVDFAKRLEAIFKPSPTPGTPE